MTVTLDLWANHRATGAVGQDHYRNSENRCGRPLQADWDDIAEKLVHAINNPRDSTRQETPFYLVHGWDDRSPLKAMTESIRQGHTNSVDTSDAAEWRREANRQSQVALYLAAEFQPTTEGPPTESETPEEPSAESPAESTRPLFKEGDQVWLFMERMKPGLTKKLAHRWHEPFRVKKKIEEFAYEIELPDKSGYRFYPVAHVSRLKAVKELGERPTTRPRPELGEAERLDLTSNSYR
ncbi:unnamed protein product [Phytophthora fragariaefolia]|uniref:Unnamed protein product n=1 Tax=Phytophthora fragariaefolia TaxID=1490495 RepID=A0A9W6U9S1_9STRA|nr:unnamed protein product [Phytophthora fragariaefolia]